MKKYFFYIIALFITYQSFSQNKTMKINDLQIDFEKIPFRGRLLIDSSINLKNDIIYNSDKGIIRSVFTDENRNTLILSTYILSCDNCDMVGKTELKFYNNNGQLLWVKTKEGLDMVYCTISENGSWVNTNWRNEILDLSYFYSFDKKGNEIFVIDSVFNMYTNVRGNIIYYERKLPQKWQVGYFCPENKNNWAKDFIEYALIRAKANNINSFIVATKTKIYSYFNDEIVWEKNLKSPLGFMDLSDDGNLLLWTSSKESILLINNKNGEIIFNLNKFYNVKEVAYGKFIENSNYFVINQNFNNRNKFVFFDVNGKVVNEQIIDNLYIRHDFIIKKDVLTDNYKLLIGNKIVREGQIVNNN